MIEFCGVLSEEIKSHFEKKLIRFSYHAALLITVILSTPIIIVAVLWSSWIYIFLFPIVMFGVFIALPKTNPQTKTLEINIPTKITISNDSIEREGDGGRNYASRPISSIKKVIDEGEWFHIIFYFGYKDSFFICQKNLIKTGTIEEFEKLFEVEIIRKTIK